MNSLLDYEEYQNKVQTAVLGPTKRAFVLPNDMKFFRTLDSDFNEDLEACNSRILAVANKLLDLASSLEHAKGKKRHKRGPNAHNLEDVLDKFVSDVCEGLEPLLERTVKFAH
jgi:exosome complex exonuclease RRP6